ncbi:MAG: hypothetical protein PHX70_10010 [Clostridium sp.]|nr:hypothetical protein [Clostridium sp.]
MAVLTNTPSFTGTNFPDTIPYNITLTAESATTVLSLDGSNVAPTSTFVGGAVVYTIYIKNSSLLNDAEGVTFTDILPTQITLGNVTSSQGTVTKTDQTVSIAVGTVAKTTDAAQPTTVTITINGTVNAAA